MDISFSVRGMSRVRSALTNLMNTFLSRNNLLKEALAAAGERAVDWAEIYTHKDTSTLSQSHEWHLIGRNEVEIYISPAMNPKHGRLTTYYGPIEHARGGSHAFYERTSLLQGHDIAQAFADRLHRGLP